MDSHFLTQFAAQRIRIHSVSGPRDGKKSSSRFRSADSLHKGLPQLLRYFQGKRLRRFMANACVECCKTKTTVYPIEHMAQSNRESIISLLTILRVMPDTLYASVS